MSKYEPLWEHLQTDGRDTFKMTFDEIRIVLGFDIDHSFLNYKKEAVEYGYAIGKISLKEKHVTFNKAVKINSESVVYRDEKLEKCNKDIFG